MKTLTRDEMKKVTGGLIMPDPGCNCYCSTGTPASSHCFAGWIYLCLAPGDPYPVCSN